jgi:mRNA-degrading endonuclease YafQ of YafQ-DinJ toxin-antitoxin module
MIYTIRTTKYFDRKFRKLKRKNKSLALEIQKTIKILQRDPFDIRLRTHTVEDIWSSRVTGDIRLRWDFIDKKTIVLLLNVGGHSGKNRVY